MNMQHTTDTNLTSDNQFVSDIIQIIRDGKDIAKHSVLHENPQLFAARHLTYLP